MEEKNPWTNQTGKAVSCPVDFKKSETIPKDDHFRRGVVCPRCGIGILEYDGLLNLSCSECNFTDVGCYT